MEVSNRPSIWDSHCTPCFSSTVCMLNPSRRSMEACPMRGDPAHLCSIPAAREKRHDALAHLEAPRGHLRAYLRARGAEAPT